MSIIKSAFNLHDLAEACHLPSPYEPGEELWNDPYISKKMLEAHLSPETDAASYRPQKIQAICAYLPQALHLKPKDTVVDLGCGPGLYSSDLARQGLKVTGIDLSENSIRYAKEHQPEPDMQYFRGSYLNFFGNEQFNAALLIYEDYGVLSPDNRIILLKNIHDALMPDGHFAFDICSLAALEIRKKTSKPNWYIADSGFWRPHRHIVLEKTFFYEDIPATCDFYAVLDSKLSIYRVYQTFFTPETITQELEENGFRVERILSDLTGRPYQPDSPTLGVICEKI